MAARRPLGGLLGASWSAAESLLDTSGALLEESGEPVGTTCNNHGCQRLPKWSPRGSQIELQRRLELKKARSHNCEHILRNSLILEVPGPPVHVQNGPKIGSQSHLRCRLALLEMAPTLLQNGPQVAPKWLQIRSWSLLESSWSSLGSLEASLRPLGSLLERSWEPLEQLWGALGGVWVASGDSFQRSWRPKGSQNGAREGPKSSSGGGSS